MVEPVYGGDCGAVPCHVVGACYCPHIQYTQPWVVYICHGLPPSGTCRQWKFHVALTACHPQFSGKDVREPQRVGPVGYGKFIYRSGHQRGCYRLPPAAVVGSGSVPCPAYAHGYFASGVGYAVDSQRGVALEHHAALIGHGQLQPAVVAGDAAVCFQCEQTGTFGIGMYAVVKQVLTVAQRFVEVYQLHAFGSCHIGYSPLKFQPPVTCARFKPVVCCLEWREKCYEYACLWIDLAQ